jgi:hypothetical protein
MDAILVLDPEKRPTVCDILHMPGVVEELVAIT